MGKLFKPQSLISFFFKKNEYYYCIFMGILLAMSEFYCIPLEILDIIDDFIPIFPNEIFIIINYYIYVLEENEWNINWLSETIWNTYGIDGGKCKYQAKIDPPW